MEFWSFWPAHMFAIKSLGRCPPPWQISSPVAPTMRTQTQKHSYSLTHSLCQIYNRCFTFALQVWYNPLVAFKKCTIFDFSYSLDYNSTWSYIVTDPPLVDLHWRAPPNAKTFYFLLNFLRVIFDQLQLLKRQLARTSRSDLHSMYLKRCAKYFSAR